MNAPGVLARAAPTEVPDQSIVEPRSLRDAHLRIVAWLLHGGAQLRTGDHAGGVAGWLDREGRAEYVYPEITGYYLQWLAWHASRPHADRNALVARAAAAQRWLGVWLTCGAPPPTRLYLRSARPDWRNAATFCFDHAMVLRGLAAAAEQCLIEPDATVVGGVCSQLLRLVAADGLLEACVIHRSGGAVPDRWSTRRGGFLAKAAAGIIGAARSVPVPIALTRAAEATFAASIGWAVASPHEDTHAFLYALEGVLSLPQHVDYERSLAALAPQFASLLERTRALGRVPESRIDSGVERLDVVAQTLRACRLLQGRESEPVAAATIPESLVRVLVRNTGSNGAVPFDARSEPPQHNVWTALFADQALAWALSADTGELSAPNRYIV